MKGLNPRHQNLLPFCSESEYHHQNGNIDPQRSTKLIDVTHVLVFDFMRKQTFFALTTSDTSSIWTTFRYERVKSEASKFIAIFNFSRFVRHSLLEVKMRKEVFEDGEGWKKSQVEVLLKVSVVNCSNREWMRDVHVAGYIEHVAEMEGTVWHCIMEQRNLGYCEAAESMGFVCMTCANEDLWLEKHS